MAGKDYWDELWDDEQLPEPVDPRECRLGAHVDRQFHLLFRELLGRVPPGSSLLEIGCARSAWLPYFAREFGFAVTGVDYSDRGCEQERRILSRAGIDGSVVCADMFSPPSTLVSSFDVVVSFGVVEHFRDTAAAVAAIARFARPGARVITTIPNVSGAIGIVQRLLNPDVYAIHVPLTEHELAAAHERAGVDVDCCRYFVSTSFGVANLNGLDPALGSVRAKAALHLGLRGFSKAVWALESRMRPLPATKALAAYVVCSGTNQ